MLRETRSKSETDAFDYHHHVGMGPPLGWRRLSNTRTWSSKPECTDALILNSLVQHGKWTGIVDQPTSDVATVLGIRIADGQ